MNQFKEHLEKYEDYKVQILMEDATYKMINVIVLEYPLLNFDCIKLYSYNEIFLYIDDRRYEFGKYKLIIEKIRDNNKIIVNQRRYIINE
jgi:hypothetical protein